MITQRLLPVLAAGSLALALAGCATDDSTDATLSAVSPTTQAASAESGASAPAEPQSPDADAQDSGQIPPESGDSTDTARDAAQATADGACATQQLDIGLSNEQGPPAHAWLTSPSPTLLPRRVR
ncbi:hypothetical protein MHJ96_11005 [Corynebacterium aurimucosum]|nr:hypothetical protein [Corynebacterium aurimucosum]